MDALSGNMDRTLSEPRLQHVACVALAFLWCLCAHPDVWLWFDGGFRVWAWLGYAVPPFINAAGPWDLAETPSWLHDGDVVVATGTKSGTTWMLYTAHLIRTHGDEAQFPFIDPMYNTPWMEMQQRPGQTWTERKAAWNTTNISVHWNMSATEYTGECHDEVEGTMSLRCLWDHAAYPFRIFKSHLTPRASGGFLPVRERPNVKFVAMVRNGLDVVASRIPFHDAHSAQFRSMWGGFPPQSGTVRVLRSVSFTVSVWR